MNDMPIGLCPICQEPLDHSDAGFCDTCDSAFCFGSCGDWEGFEQKCNKCLEEQEES